MPPPLKIKPIVLTCQVRRLRLQDELFEGFSDGPPAPLLTNPQPALLTGTHRVNWGSWRAGAGLLYVAPWESG